MTVTKSGQNWDVEGEVEEHCEHENRFSSGLIRAVSVSEVGSISDHHI